MSVLAVLVLLALAVGCCVAAGLVVRRPGPRLLARALLAALLAAALWCGADAALAIGAGPAAGPVRGAAWAATYGSALAVWFLARTVTDPAWVPRRTWLRLAGTVPPVLLVLLGAVSTGPVPVLAGIPLLHDARVDGPGLTWDTLLAGAVAVEGVARFAVARRRLPPFARRRLRVLTLVTTAAALLVGAAVLGASPVDPGAGPPVGFALITLVTADVLLHEGLLTGLVPPTAEQVLASLPDGVVVLDAQGLVVLLNAASHRMLAVPPDRAPGLPAADVLPAPVTAAAADRAGAPVVVGLASGARVEVVPRTLRTTHGEVLGTVLLHHDVSAHADAHDELDRARRRLEQQVRSLEVEADRLRDVLTRSEVRRSELAEQAVRDPLTGVHNRRGLGSTLPAALAAARGAGSRLAVMVIDVDHFKLVNDTYGHGVGDGVLQAVAQELLLSGREGEHVVRYGGEEFVLVAPGLEPLAAIRRAEEVRAAVARVRVPLRAGGAVGVTVSVGVACFPDDGVNAGDLLAAADGALYAAKESGRNCVVAA